MGWRGVGCVGRGAVGRWAARGPAQRQHAGEGCCQAPAPNQAPPPNPDPCEPMPLTGEGDHHKHLFHQAHGQRDRPGRKIGGVVGDALVGVVDPRRCRAMGGWAAAVAVQAIVPVATEVQAQQVAGQPSPPLDAKPVLGRCESVGGRDLRFQGASRAARLCPPRSRCHPPRKSQTPKPKPIPPCLHVIGHRKEWGRARADERKRAHGGVERLAVPSRQRGHEG